MAWKEMDKVKEGNGMYLALKDGESIQMVFVGEPVCFYYRFKDKSEHLEQVPESSFRFKINVAVKENGAYVMKLFNQGITVGKSIKKLLEKLGPNTLFEIEREGSTKDNTTYHLIPLGALSPEDVKNISALKPIPIKVNAKEDTSFNTEEYDRE